VFGFGVVALGVWVMTRYGLVSLTVAVYVALVLNTTPITLDPHSWYVDQSLYVLALVAALAVYGFIAARSESIAR
jgi:hypothetical protein